MKTVSADEKKKKKSEKKAATKKHKPFTLPLVIKNLCSTSWKQGNSFPILVMTAAPVLT